MTGGVDMTVRPYVDARVDDADTALDAARVAASKWALPEPYLLRHGMNAIHRSGDVVLRVASPTVDARRSIELALLLTSIGVPTVVPAFDDVVEHGGLSVTAWHHIAETSTAIDWSSVGRIVRRVHDLGPADLPLGLPLPSPVDFPWWRFESMLDELESELDAQSLGGLRAALERHAEWESFDETVVCHGDVHPGNVMMTESGPVLIDWDLLCRAPRGWDHGPLMTWTETWGGGEGIYEAFADGYGWSARGDTSAEAFAELRLVAATLMRVRAGLNDPLARPEAERRLRHWRGDPAAPVWRAQ